MLKTMSKIEIPTTDFFGDMDYERQEIIEEKVRPD